MKDVRRLKCSAQDFGLCLEGDEEPIQVCKESGVTQLCTGQHVSSQYEEGSEGKEWG